MNENTAYTTRDEAIEREIIDPIEASGVIEDACAEYDIGDIADKALGDYREGYACQVSDEDFWEIVAAHETKH